MSETNLRSLPRNVPPPLTKLLLVDDDETIRHSLGLVLRHSGFEVATAGSVKDALSILGSQTFDVLLSDLHMPGAGDGLTVVSAMRHANPRTVTIIFSGYPDMKEAAAAILLHADEILVKPLAPDILIQTIRDRMSKGAGKPQYAAVNVANILEQNAQATIEEWFLRVEMAPLIITVPLEPKERCAHLPQLFRDLVFRLRNPQELGTLARISPSASKHGMLRREQGYSAAMMVEESRMLQVSIFQTLQNNLHRVDFSLLLVGVMAIADEVDSQLAQAMSSYILESR